MSYEAPKVPQNILTLTTDEKRKFLDSIDYVFSDIDGVLMSFHYRIEGAPEGFKELQNAGKKLYFLTNNSVRSTEMTAKSFGNIGFDYDVKDIIHPAKSVIEYLNHIKFDGLIYIIAGDNFKAALREAGFKFIDGPSEIFAEKHLRDTIMLACDKEPVRAVILDYDFNTTTIKLLRAQHYLRNPECLLIEGATDLSLPWREDVNILGPGFFSKRIAEACNREPITLGKPGKELAKLLINNFNIKDTKRVLMIGDMLEQDIGFGKECGFQTLIVLSGGCKLQHFEAQSNAKLLPDYYAESMGDFVEFMKDLHKSNV